MSRPQDDRNQEATVYLVCVLQASLWTIHSAFICISGQPWREVHRCAYLGINASSGTRWWALDRIVFGWLNWSLSRLIVNVHLPKDRISMAHQGYGFCEFLTEEDAEYACKIMNQIKLWGKPIRVNKVRFRFQTILFFSWDERLVLVHSC